MIEKCKAVWEKLFKPYIKKDNLILLVLAGILLLIISMPTQKKAGSAAKDQSAATQSELLQSGLTRQENDAMQETWELDAESYRKELQNEIAEILSGIDGAGEVMVMITFKESQESIIEKDRKKTQKQTGENGEGNSEKIASEITSQECAVMSGNKEPFVTKRVYPKVEGVLVLAQGVGKGHVRADLSEAVQALLGLEAHKIKVLKLGHIQSTEGIKWNSK